MESIAEAEERESAVRKEAARRYVGSSIPQTTEPASAKSTRSDAGERAGSSGYVSGVRSSVVDSSS